jgi:predicted permease
MLIAGQVAFSIILVSLAVATIRSLDRLSHVALGYDPVHLASVTLHLRDNTYTEWRKRVNYFAEIRNKVAAIPELTSAAIAYTWLPPISLYRSRAEIPSVIDANPLVTMQQVSAEYFLTLRIPMVEGRSWTEPEVMRAAHIAIINAAMANHYWPKQDPIGRMIHLDELRAKNVWTLSAPGNNGWVQVVGVVGNTPNNGLREPVLPTVYVPHTLVAGDTFDLVVRTNSNPLSVVRSIRERIHQVNQDQTVEQVMTAEQRLESEGFARERFIMLLFSCFAMLGLCLAGVGIYSVVSYAVSWRTREFAVRLAFGARRPDVLQSALKATVVTILTGVGVGSVASLAIGRLVEHWIEGKVHDPTVLITSMLVLLLVTGIASIVPAIRALCISPMAVLRQE